MIIRYFLAIGVFFLFSCGTIPKGDLVQRKILNKSLKQEGGKNRKISYKKESITVFNIRFDENTKIEKANLSIFIEQKND